MHPTKSGVSNEQNWPLEMMDRHWTPWKSDLHESVDAYFQVLIVYLCICLYHPLLFIIIPVSLVFDSDAP